MRSKNKSFSNFSHAVHTRADCFRPDNEKQIEMLAANHSHLLARGKGLSYSDCCLNDKGIIIDTSRLNHLLSFDESSGLLVCQGHVSFAELMALNFNYIPPVIPGTLHATLAGGIANDVHGKNNHRCGSLGEHVQWLDIQVGSRTLRCSRTENNELFQATIGGLGLTGIIKRVGINMQKASQFVSVIYEKYNDFSSLLSRMQHEGCQFDYQVAWLDLLNKKPRAILSLANHCEHFTQPIKRSYPVPTLPFRLINSWFMSQFNRYYFNKKSHARSRILPLSVFNNPLDKLTHWNRLYGPKGLLQFQSLFKVEIASTALTELIEIIDKYQAIPTLAVLKYFTQTGSGLLSFAEPGFTLAIDFINNAQAKKAILAMNQWITHAEGKVYLAKDLLLTASQFRQQYPNYPHFSRILTHYQSLMRSDLGARLEIGG